MIAMIGTAGSRLTAIAGLFLEFMHDPLGIEAHRRKVLERARAAEDRSRAAARSRLITWAATQPAAAAVARSTAAAAAQPATELGSQSRRCRRGTPRS
jgi:hypothetical protein